MLKQRVITALVLLAILLPALFYPSVVPFAVVVLLLMASDGRFYDLHHLNTFCSGNWDFFSVKNGLVHSLKKSIVIALFCGHEFFDNSSIAFGVE